MTVWPKELVVDFLLESQRQRQLLVSSSCWNEGLNALPSDAQKPILYLWKDHHYIS